MAEPYSQSFVKIGQPLTHYIFITKGFFSRSDFWTGLHNVPGATSLFLWQGSCTQQGPYQPWDELEMPETFRCVEADSRLQPGRILENSACSYIGAKALCENKQGKVANV